MEVSEVQEVVKKKEFNGEEKYYHTFFSLSTQEQKLYDSFRAKHNDLEKIIRRLEPEQRRELEKEVCAMFIELITPYLKRCRLEAEVCYLTYGDHIYGISGYHRQTNVNTQYYPLFENNKPFNGVRATYLFSTSDKDLSCSSRFNYRMDESSAKPFIQQGLIGDLLEKIFEKKENDGIISPIIKKFGNSTYFASSDFAKPLIDLLKNIFEKIGLKSMNKLNDIYMSRYRPYILTGSEDSKRMSKEGYEKRLESELIRAGFIPQSQ